ncbi:hypothetical protein PV04_04563 [Phialophora macrospora]|uniref:Uncharacterized protein n=1 Tax=Phialophora macrospora TaxID=1851006 RepID=A0A0D2G9L7_9EURO|nr:hypothetical protein PV04_04563 [Phialophora macrospora]
MSPVTLRYRTNMGPSSMANLFTFYSLPTYLSVSQYALSFLNQRAYYFDWRPLDAEDGGGLVPSEDENHYYLPPRTLLRAPFTVRKREILIYLMQELAVRAFLTETVEHRGPEQDANLLHQAILDAIPTGDVRFLRYLIYLALQVDSAKPKSLSGPVNERPSTVRSQMARIPMDIGQALFDHLPTFLRSERGEQYILEAIKAGQTDIFALLVDHWLLSCTEELLGQFESTMTRLLQTALESTPAKDDSVDDRVHVRAQALIIGRRQAIESAKCVIEYQSEMLDGQQLSSPGQIEESPMGNLKEECSKAR